MAAMTFGPRIELFRPTIDHIYRRDLSHIKAEPLKAVVSYLNLWSVELTWIDGQWTPVEAEFAVGLSKDEAFKLGKDAMDKSGVVG